MAYKVNDTDIICDINNTLKMSFTVPFKTFFLPDWTQTFCRLCVVITTITFTYKMSQNSEKCAKVTSLKASF